MFTIPPFTPSPGGFIDSGNTPGERGSRLMSGWLNYVSTAFPRVLDAIQGGYYQFTGDIRLSSDIKQVKINAPDSGHKTELRGFVKIALSDDANYVTGTGTLTVDVPATFSAGVTMSGALTFSNTVQFDGAVTVNAATTFTSNGDIAWQSGCTVTGSSGSSLTMNSGSTTTIGGTVTLTNPSEIAFSAARSYRQPVHISYIDVNFWAPDATTPSAWPHKAQQSALTNPANFNEHITYEADVPAGGSCVQVEVWVEPSTGHGGLPANRPAVYVWLYDSDAGTTALLASASADAGSLGAYEVRTLLTATASVNTLAVPQKIIVRVAGEYSTNAMTGLVVDEPTVTFTTPKMNFP